MQCLGFYLTGREPLSSPAPVPKKPKLKPKFGAPSPFLRQANSSLDKKNIQVLESSEKKAGSGFSFNPLKFIKKIFRPEFPTDSNIRHSKQAKTSGPKGFQSEAEEPALYSFCKEKKNLQWNEEEPIPLENEHEDIKVQLSLESQSKPSALLEEEEIDHSTDASSRSALSLGDGLLKGLQEMQKVVDSEGKPVYSISDQEIREMFNHIEQHAATYINHAKTKNEAILIHADESRGLHRSLVVTPEGDVFVLFNRGSKGDQKFFGTDKAVSRAIHLNSGELYASEAMDESYQDSSGQRPNPSGKEPYWTEKRNADILRNAGIGSDQILVPGYGVVYKRQKKSEYVTRPQPVSNFRGRLFSKFCNQGTLESWLKQDREFKDKAHLFNTLAPMIFALHKKNVVLRDLKLDNILIHENKCYISDIGSIGPIGEIGRDNLLRIEGNESSFSPELLRWLAERKGDLYLDRSSQNIQNKSADIWAFGLSMLMMFHGQVLDLSIDRNKLTESEIRRHVGLIKESLASLLKKHPNNPYLHLIERMLDENPETRITAEEVVAELEKISAPLPLPPLPPRD